ncbi:class I SAM-dependent methyltransferase [Leekyejoonella antrihumi]|uniref:Class I SAM-dependent methyltransferase n=1 Tax=Leekyejoonella antrihumi TaxID=1660198 RepID=A0A563DVJ4_9MICO|nr:class I SAM-dependent methyltransferase [Leekyejoonella antrihumi]TWP33963.1 class I SAM-dependent methyltransferase [Leekyejoonella antrihumi]
MGIYADSILPRIIDRTMRHNEFSVIRARVASGLSGCVLEVGFGSGLNVPHYPSAVTRVLAVDPSRTGRRLAAGRIAASPVPVDSIALDGQAIPLDDACVDHALTTWTLCTIPEVDQAMIEIARVLRPGGSLHFVEHGRSPDPAVARWQDRLTPIQRRVAGGCHLNRPIDQIIGRSGLRLDTLETSYMAGPKAFGYLYEGIATKR